MIPIDPTLPLFVPDLQTGEFLYALLIFMAASAILFGIRPEYVLSVLYLYMIITFIDLLGPSPFLAMLVIITAALARLVGEGGQKLTRRISNVGPETLAALAPLLDTVIDRVFSSGGSDREND